MEPSDLLSDLLRRAGLPRAIDACRLSGRGLDHELQLAELADGRRVVLRRWCRPRERERAILLEAPGALLGDLIESGRASPSAWRLVGAAYRRVHAVRFPAGLAGDVEPEGIVLRPVDPVGQMHIWLDGCVPGLRRRAAGALAHLDGL